MRRAGALAASGLLALVIGAAACKPSSLTPFTDWREEQTETTGVNGHWLGEAVAADGQPGTIEFTVASERIADIRLHHSTGSCGRLFFSTTTTESVENDAFHVDMTLETQGRVVIDGTFTSSTTCTGTYYFEGIRITGDCPSSDSGTFTAAKTQ
jgi:hypothetical protein